MLTQPAVAKATRYNRETPPQGVASGSRVETAAEGQSLQQQGEPHTSRAEPQQATGTPGRESTVQLKKKKRALRQGAT